MLRETGYLVFSELVWLEDNPPRQVAEFWRTAYPAMTNIAKINEQVCNAGYEVIGDFTIPDSAWWDDYYTPLQARLPALRRKYEGDQEAMEVIVSTEAEIDVRRRFPDSYGYHFFVTRIS